jgi:hypothetical protein
MKKCNKGIFLASISGFGSNGQYSYLPGYDYIIQAMSGLMSITGDKDAEPVKVGVAIADVLTGLYTRLLVFKAGWLKNSGKHNTQETSLAKWISCDAAYEAANDAVQIHGACGFSNEFPVERYLRNAKAPVIYEGTREIHTIMQGMAAQSVFDSLTITVEIDKKSGVIIQSSCTLATDHGREYIQHILKGHSLQDGIDEIVEMIREGYHGKAVNALIAAVKDLYSQYSE